MKRKYAHIFLIAPSFAYLLLVLIIPLFFPIFASFVSYQSFSPTDVHFVGLSNFIKVIFGEQQDFLILLRNTSYFALGSVTLEFIFGFSLALLLNSRDIKRANVFLMFILSPIAISPVVTGLTWRYIYEPENGVIGALFRILNLNPIVFLANPRLAMPALILANAWQWTPFMVLLLYAGLKAIPDESYEAAKVEGANSLQLFLHITFPLLQPVIWLALILRTIEAFKVFDIIFLTTMGGPGVMTEVLSLRIYRLGILFSRIDLASALSIVLLILVTIVTYMYVRMYVRRFTEYI